MIIRPVVAEDHAALWPLLRDVFRPGETYAVPREISEQDALNYWTAQHAYVAVQADRIIGTYYIKTNQQGGGAHICNCGYIIAPEAQGQGAATQMCAHSQAEAARLGYKAMQFNLVLASNTGAVKLWKRLGFATVGTIPEAFDHPTLGMVDAYVMYKRLVG